VEVGFVAYLKLKEAYARAEGDDERAAIVARAAERFLADHLSAIAAPVADILNASHLDYLARASRILADRVGPAPRSTMLPMFNATPDEEDGGEFACATS
jgi:hypothetical protein